MAEKHIELKIDRLAGLGDGVGISDGRKVFVPYTTADDIIQARITKETSDAVYAFAEEILTSGPDRIKPACRHFGICGGCSLQHITPALYKEFKQNMAVEAVRKAGLDTACVQPLITFAPHTRRRADFKIQDGKLGFYAGQSHDLVDIEECKVLEPELFELTMQLKPLLKGITALQINGVDGGYDVLAEGNATSSPQLQNLQSLKRFSVRFGKKITTLHQKGDVTLTLDGVAVDIPPGAFLQASREAQELMTKLITNTTINAGSIIDLFSGIGTYSIPMSRHAKVLAIEGDGAMTLALQAASSKYKLRIRTSARDLFVNPAKAAELKKYDAVVINPPRAGAKTQSEEIAQAKVGKVVMVSCNPATFTRDARILKEGGYKLVQLTPVDQFVYSSHLELMTEFTR